MPFRNQNQSIQGLRTPQLGSMNWTAPAGQAQIGPSNFLTASQANSGTAVNAGGSFNTVFNNQPGGGFDLGNYSMSQYGQQPPAAVGGWTDPNGKGGFALGVAQVGLGVYNAMEQSKMNKFMKSYYGDQMDLMKADYSNNARSANQSLSWQQQQIDSAKGIDPNSAEGQKINADYMAQWGAKETV